MCDVSHSKLLTSMTYLLDKVDLYSIAQITFHPINYIHFTSRCLLLKSAAAVVAVSHYASTQHMCVSLLSAYHLITFTTLCTVATSYRYDKYSINGTFHWWTILSSKYFGCISSGPSGIRITNCRRRHQLRGGGSAVKTSQYVTATHRWAACHVICRTRYKTVTASR